MFLQPSKHLSPTVFITAIAALVQREPIQPPESDRHPTVTIGAEFRPVTSLLDSPDPKLTQ